MVQISPGLMQISIMDRSIMMETSKKEVLQILKEHKFNSIRLRLFVDPSAYVPGEEWDNPYSTKGYCGLERTVAFAKK